jgi:hypothetical protein
MMQYQTKNIIYMTTEKCAEKIKALTKEEIKLANDILQSPDDAVIVSFFNIIILGKDIKRLAPNNWLRTDIIDFYSGLINNRVLLRKKSNYYCFLTFAASKIMQGESFEYNNIRRWAEKLKVNFSELDKLLLPYYNESNKHFTLAVVNFAEKKFQYYDSFHIACPELLLRLRQYMHHASVDLDGWQDEHVKDIPKQLNGSDCGMFVCKFMDYITDDCPFSFTHEHMSYFRTRMALEIKHVTLDLSRLGQLQFGSSVEPLPLSREQSFARRRNNCYFNPEKSCGSFVRTGLGYTRKALEKAAVECGMEPTLVSRLTMDTLCQLLKSRYFEQQNRHFLVEFFALDKVLPGYQSRWKDIANRPDILDAETFDLLLPIPGSLHVLQRFEQDAESYALTIGNAAALLSHPLALNNYKLTLRKIIAALQQTDLHDLIPSNHFLACKMKLRVLVSSCILSPSDYSNLSENITELKPCQGVSKENIMQYAQLFKSEVFKYIQNHYKTFPINYFVKFYSNSLSLDFYFVDYLYTKKIDFIKSMVVFPITLDMTSTIKLMSPLVEPVFPLTVASLSESLQSIATVRPQLIKAMEHTFQLLDLQPLDQDHSQHKIKQSSHPIQQILQLIGRMMATAHWFGIHSHKQFLANILFPNTLQFLNVPYLDSFQVLLAHIQYTDYSVFRLKQMSEIRKSYKLNEWKDNIPSNPQNVLSFLTSK